MAKLALARLVSIEPSEKQAVAVVNVTYLRDEGVGESGGPTVLSIDIRLPLLLTDLKLSAWRTGALAEINRILAETGWGNEGLDLAADIVWAEG
jgi:hypothetical protein